MTNYEFVKELATKTGYTQGSIKEVVNAVSEFIVEKVAEGETVGIPGLGKFAAVERAARTCRNPQTGDPIEVPATKVPKFRAATSFKDAVK